MIHFRPTMKRAGFTDEFMAAHVREFRQGFLSMGPAISILEEKLVSGKLRHGDHPILRMCFSNVVVVTDEVGNRKFSKKRSTGRIDIAPALAMAVAALPPDTPAPDFDIFFINSPW
jgi:phage terminase large subunit-like protein